MNHYSKLHRNVGVKGSLILSKHIHDIFGGAI
jgi:hypothetical protein